MARDGAEWELDSTWEEEEEGSELERRPAPAAQEKKKPTWANSYGRTKGSQRNWRAAYDMQRYRHHYPDLQDSEYEEEPMLNLKFYKNEMRFQPNGIKIEELLKFWLDDYDILEDKHTYIQWLFPLREEGMNWYAKPLTQREMEEFKKSDKVMERFIQAYELMLGFYGITLVTRETGQVARSENWKERFQNLNRHTHNNLRITRILKCLGEMSLERYQGPLVKFFLKETLVEDTLPNVKRSVLDYFLFTVRNKQQRRELVYYAWKHFRPRMDFVWAPLQKLKRFEAQQQTSAVEPGPTGTQKDDEATAEECDPEEERTETVTLNQDSQSEQGNGDKGERGHRRPNANTKNANISSGLRTAKDCKKRKLEGQAIKSSKNGTEQPNSPDVDTISSSFQEISMTQCRSEAPVAASAVDEKGPAVQTEDMSKFHSDSTTKRRKRDQAEAQKGNVKVPESLDSDPSPGDVEETSTEGAGPLQQEEDILKMDLPQGDVESQVQNSALGSDSLLLPQPSHPEDSLKQDNTETFSSKNEAPAQSPSANQAEGAGTREGCVESGEEIEKGEDPGGDEQHESPLTNFEGSTEPLGTTSTADEANALNLRKGDVPRVEANGNSEDVSGSPQPNLPIQQCNQKDPAGGREPETSPSIVKEEQHECETAPSRKDIAKQEPGASAGNNMQNVEEL